MHNSAQYCLSIFIALISIGINGQNKNIDSLKLKAQQYALEHNDYQKDTTYINLLIKIGKSFEYITLDSIKSYAIKSKQLSSKINYAFGEVASQNNLANYYMLKSKYDKARELHLSNLNDSKKLGFNTITAKTFNSLAYIYLSNNNYPAAYKTCLEGRDFAKTNNDFENIISLNSNIGFLFVLLKDYKESLRYFKECLSYEAIDNNPVNRAKVEANMAVSYLNLEEYDTALKYAERSLKVFKEKEIPHWKAVCYVALGGIYSKQDSLDMALGYFNLAKSEHGKIEYKKGKIEVKLGLSNTYLLLSDTTLAENYAAKAKQLSEEIKYLEGSLRASELLYKTNKLKNNYDVSLNYLETVKKLSDSLSAEENKNILLMDQARIEFEKEKENLKALTDKTIIKQRKYIQWSVFALIASIVIAVLIFKSHKREKRLNKKLAEKTEVLSKKQVRLDRINKNQDKLFSIVGHDLRGPIVSLKELINLSLENKSGEQHFKRFAPKLKKDLDHIHFTLDNLLNWGQTQMNGASIHLEEISIKTEIDGLLNLFRKNLAQKSITLQNNVDKDLMVMADFNHFNIIFRNLVNNAIKFTRENGNIWIDAVQKKGYVFISIKDDGIGMTNETMSKIFDNSRHFSTFGTDRERGTGLGLLLSQEMVKKNKGTLKVESTVGIGSVFEVCLPDAL